jgi:AraC-like DNA-binding protein
MSEESEPQQFIRIVEEALLLKIPAALPGSRMQRAAESLLANRGTSSLSDVAGSLGFSDSSWRRHFTSQIGVPPKRYLRMLRFRHAVALKRQSPRQSWTHISQQAGYYDQSHFIGEFREMSGASPSEFMRELEAAPMEMTAAFYGFSGNLQIAADIPRTIPVMYQGAA